MENSLNKEKRLFSDIIAQLAEHTIFGLAGTLINSSVIVVIFWRLSDKSQLLIWFFSLLVVSIVRIYLQNSFEKFKSTEESLNNWKNYFLCTLLISGIIWGSSGIILFPVHSTAHQSFLAFVLGGMVAGAVGVFSSMLIAFLAFSIPALFPLIFKLATISDPIHLSMAFMLFLFWSIMLLTAGRLHRNLLQSFELKYENIELITNLKNEIEARKAVEVKLIHQKNEIESIVEQRTKELKEAQLRQDEVIKAGHVGLWDWDLNTDKVQYSEEWKQQIGYEPREVSDDFEEWRSRVHPDDLEPLLNRMQQSIDELQSDHRMEFRLRHRDGSYRWILAQASILQDKKGHPVRMLGSNIDITERKRMEDELLRFQKLESVGMLAGGIAHDFNNVLTTILGNVSMARDQATPESEIFELLSDAETASKRAQVLTKQLLTFAKGGAPIKTVVSLGDIIKESSQFVMSGSKSRCEFSIAEDLRPVEVDVGQISQVISHIVLNSSQAMPEGGIIKIKAEDLIIDEGNEWSLKPGRYVRVYFKDEGTGIAEKDLAKIFDPYFTTKKACSGLGLTISYSIVKNHDGLVTVESNPGIDTTFHIYLPASEKSVPQKEEKKLIQGRGRILVMDDEAPLRKMVGRMLQKLGYEPEFAQDGAEAIEVYKNAEEAGEPFDAVILDLTIPGGMGGRETIQELLQIDPNAKAIVSSGYSDDPVLSKFEEYGFKGMLPKPFESKTLSKVLYNVLKGEKD